MNSLVDAVKRFDTWFNAAGTTELNDANAMYLATVDKKGMPNVRVVLLKSHDTSGFVFYTNTQSAKGHELLANKVASLCFDWKSRGRRVIISGTIDMVSNSEADSYFNSRARQSRIGAWASKQSRPLKSKMHLVKKVAEYALKFPVGPIPRPPFWTGFRLQPTRICFQQTAGETEIQETVFTFPATPTTRSATTK
ncbi:MAG: pyridoxamine 5'-phosphate oxidase [Rhizobiaceae bacterium]